MYPFILQEEQLHSSEREKQSLREQLTRTEAEAQQQLRQKVDVLVFDDVTSCVFLFFRKNSYSQMRGRSCQRTEN